MNSMQNAGVESPCRVGFLDFVDFVLAGLRGDDSIPLYRSQVQPGTTTLAMIPLNLAKLVCLKMGYTPNEIAIKSRDNDQQNHWVQWGTLFLDKPKWYDGKYDGIT